MSGSGCGSGCGCGWWWLVAMGVGNGSGFRFCSGLVFLMVGGDLGFLMMVVAGGGHE